MRLLAAFGILFLLSHTQPGYAARAHIHGQGDLDVAVDGNRVEVLLIAPLMDLQTEAAGGPDALAARVDLFEFGSSACELESGFVSSESTFEDVWRDDDDGHAHSTDHQHDHETDAHDDEHNHDHDDDHAHDDQSSDGHSDSYITWIFRCASKPEQLTVQLFQDTRLERIRVQAAGASGAQADTLTVDNNSIALP